MSSSKNILAINPWIYDFTAYDFWMKPLGLLYIASVLKKYARCQVTLIDCLDRHHPLLAKAVSSKPDGRGAFPKEEVEKPGILKDIPRKYSRYGIPVPLFLQELEAAPPPDLVILTCVMTYWYPGAQLAVELTRKKFGHVPIVLGGIYASLMSEHARSYSGANIVVTGRGELKVLSLVKDILGDNAARPFEPASLDNLPWPSFELLRKRDTLPILTSRGCPFDCAFCATAALNPLFEQRDSSSVEAEIEAIYLRFGTRNFAFYDDALLINKKYHLFPILEKIAARKWPLSFHTPNGLHVKEVDQEIAEIMMRSGFRSLYLSQESLDEKWLSESCPKVSTGDLQKALDSLEKAGFRKGDINVYLMAGFPGQDISAVKESIVQVQRLGARPRLAYFSPVPGSKEWARLISRGRLSENSDPLLHNKLVLPYLGGDFSPEDFESLGRMLLKG
jgi:radical SAM superfamily enzyme YgiQ (UPF0313 family)